MLWYTYIYYAFLNVHAIMMNFVIEEMTLQLKNRLLGIYSTWLHFKKRDKVSVMNFYIRERWCIFYGDANG